MPEYSELFVERMKAASINGKPFADVEAHAVWTEWNKTLYTPGVRVEDGENFDDLIARADAALAFLEARAETSIAVVTHGYFFRTVVARAVLGGMLSGEAFKRFQRIAGMENTGLAAMRYREAPARSPAGASSFTTTTRTLANAGSRLRGKTRRCGSIIRASRLKP